MLVSLKFWNWKIRKSKKETDTDIVDKKAVIDSPEDNTDYKLYPVKNLVLTTTETELELKTCKVRSDHFLSYKDAKVDQGKKRQPRIMMKPHQMTIPLWEILPKKPLKLWIAKLILPRFLRFRTYTVRREGEITHDIHGTPFEEKQKTHDPNEDGYKLEDKMNLEKMLELEGKFAEAEAGAHIYEGMKGPKKWQDYIPYIVLMVIVIAFLFSFQIAPNV